jgi:hypothetical protein
MKNPKNMSDIELLEAWSQKALVCLCADPSNDTRVKGLSGSHYMCGSTNGEWCGPQKVANRLKTEINRRKIALPLTITVALLEDCSCGRRKGGAGSCEFDMIMKDFVSKYKKSTNIG